MQDQLVQITVIGGILLANGGALVAFFVSLKVAIAELKIGQQNLEKDVNNLGNLYRQTTKQER